MKPNLPVPTYPAAAFTWSGTDGSTEASCLGVRAGSPVGARLYDDACDVGFALRSDRTGRVVHFALRREFASNGEIHGWNFRSLDGRFNVIIFND